MIKIYRNKRYAFISLTGLLLWFFSFSLQSCSSIGRNKSNIIPITREDLLGQAVVQAWQAAQVGPVVQAGNVIGPLTSELNNKISRLINEGFVGGSDPNDNDIRKHLVFVFHHSLRLRRTIPVFDELGRNQFVAEFTQVPYVQHLVWDCVPVHRPRSLIRPYMVEFRLRDLFTDDDPHKDDNLDKAQGRIPPDLEYNGRLQKIEIDHLLKDNSITIELPLTLHKQKTKLIDNLMNSDEIRVTRDSAGYWEKRRNEIT